MSQNSYPKVTQESLTQSMQIVMSVLTDPDYLKQAPYSNVMLRTINDSVQQVHDHIARQIHKAMIESAAEASAPPPPPPEATEAEVLAEIHEQFSELTEDMENRSGEYRDNFGILVRIEKTLRTIANIANKGSSDSVKMSATTKLMDFQKDELEILERLMNLEKAQKIESITRRFFQEIRQFDQLKPVADRYLELIQDIN